MKKTQNKTFITMRKLLSIFCLYGISLATAHAQVSSSENSEKRLDSIVSTYLSVRVEVVPAENHKAVTYQNIPYTLTVPAKIDKDNFIISNFVQLACLYYKDPEKGIWASLNHKKDEAFNTSVKVVNNYSCEYFIGHIISARKLTTSEIATTKEWLRQNGY